MRRAIEDRALLNHAARAAGFELHWAPLEGGPLPIWRERGCSWNPLVNSGTALELAVDLRLHVDISRDSVSVYWWDESDTVQSYDEELGDDPAAAVRRCIVRAAAEMAKVEA